MPTEEGVLHASLESLIQANEVLVQDTRGQYDTLLLKFDNDRFQSICGDSNDVSCSSNMSDNNEVTLDPLSMLLKEDEDREAREAQERLIRRTSIMKDIVASHEIVAVVRKDLERLHDEHTSYYRSRANWKHLTQNNGEETDFETARDERNELLLQMLHLYGKAHLLPGYQQGMHEIFSFVMFVIEMDLFDIETSARGEYKVLLSAEYLLHDSYAIAEAILSRMTQAYGVCDDDHDDPVEHMGESILQKIQYVARDKQLYTYLKSMEWDLSLYTARWVRLLFAREAGGWRNALSLWDIFFDIISTTSTITSMQRSMYTRPGVTPEIHLGEFDLMTVLEMTAASLVWMRRELLETHDVDEGLQMLTGMDSLKDVDPLISTLLSSLHSLQISPKMAPLLHPDHTKSSRRLFPASINRRSQSPFIDARANESSPINARDSLIRFLSSRKLESPSVPTIHRGLSLQFKLPRSHEAKSTTPAQSSSTSSQNLGETLAGVSKSYNVGSESRLASLFEIGNMFSPVPSVPIGKDTTTIRNGSARRSLSLSRLPLDSIDRDCVEHRRSSLDNPNMKILLSAPRLDNSQESLFGTDDDENFTATDSLLYHVYDQDPRQEQLSCRSG